MKTPLCLFVLTLAGFAFAERQPYSRYATIVDRQMFGQPPPGFDPSKMPSEVAKSSSRDEKALTEEQEKVKKAIRFSVINVTPGGETVVGFSDNGDPHNALHYYLKVGESQNGWTVKEADPKEATMTIEKEGIEVTLKLGGDSASSPDSVTRAPATASSGASSRAALLGTGLRERRQQREAEEAAKRAEEEKARAEREKQRDEVQNELLNQLNSLREEQRKREEESARKASEATEQAAEG